MLRSFLTMSLKNSSVSCAHRVGELLVVVREQERVRMDLVEVLQPQPLRGEARGERLGARIGEHALALRARASSASESLFCCGELEQLVVRDAAPEEERQPRREVEVADLVVLARRDVRRQRSRSGTRSTGSTSIA